MPPPQTALPAPPRMGGAGTAVNSLSNRRLVLGSLMTLSLSLLWLTNETTEGTAAPLAFSDAGDTTGGLGVLIAFGLWTAACIQIRKRVDATP